jgi:hypothetical protein
MVVNTAFDVVEAYWFGCMQLSGCVVNVMVYAASWFCGSCFDVPAVVYVWRRKEFQLKLRLSVMLATVTT